MTNRLSLAAFLLFCTAAPLWIYLMCIVANSPGFGSLGNLVAAPVLCAATAAIYYLTDRSWFGLALAAMLSVVALYESLLLIALWSTRGS